MAHFSQLPFFTLSPTIHSSLKHRFSAVYTLLLSNILTLKVSLYCPNYKLLSLIGSLHEIPLVVGEFEINSAVSFFSSVLMADSEYSTSNDTICVDSQEESSQEAKLEFSEDEETLIIRMFNLVGERWSLIAGRIPGRTAEEIEKYWNSRYSTSE